jgi:RNA polymerase sigma-70 factor (ECF subfamily)
MDQSILEKLYRQHFNKTFRTAYLVTRDYQLAEDATQEAFLRAFSNLAALREIEKFGSWVSVIAANYSIDLLRKKKKIVFTDNISLHASNSPGDSPQESWEKNETAQEIREALFLLAPEEREILVLKYFNELSIKEIAAATDAPAGTVKSRLFRARKKIRALLQPSEDEKRQISKISSKL